MIVIWKSIPGFGNFYEASNDGQVRSLDRISMQFHNASQKVLPFRIKGRVIRQYSGPHGYRMVGIHFKGKRQSIHVGRLMLMAFSGEPTCKDQYCRHLDGNFLNNNLDNLAWGSHAQNMADRKAHGRYYSDDRHPLAKLTNSQALAIYQSTDSCAVLAKRFGVQKKCIYDIWNGESWLSVTGGPRRKSSKFKETYGTNAELLAMQNAAMGLSTITTEAEYVS